MSFGIYSILEVCLLFINAICVLHEERFLRKIGVSSITPEYGQTGGVKMQLYNLIRSIRTVMRGPLIFVNIAVIIFKMVLG